MASKLSKQVAVEWAISHGLWEFAKMLVGAALASIGISIKTGLTSKDVLSWFLIIGGGLIILWAAGVFPRKREGYKNLRRRCEDLIVEWLELAELWQNSRKDPEAPATLPEPMSPTWVSSPMPVFPNRIGVLQGATNALRSELRGTTVSVEQWDYRISLPRVIEALRRYSAQL